MSANDELVWDVARAALGVFNGDDEAMTDAISDAPEKALSRIARAIIPLVLEHAAGLADACERPREDACCIGAYRHVSAVIRQHAAAIRGAA